MQASILVLSVLVISLLTNRTEDIGQALEKYCLRIDFSKKVINVSQVLNSKE